MNKIYTTTFSTSMGELIIGIYDNQLCLCDWKFRKMRDSIDRRIQSGLEAEYMEGREPLALETIRQLEEYMAGNRKQFELPLLLAGTSFQKKVWNELMIIPFGKSISYHELANKLGDLKAVRAVATASGANAISIIVPCHRVIGSDGNLTGYAGGLHAKNKLLQLESLNPETRQLRLFHN